jgi:hypothetical protein
LQNCFRKWQRAARAQKLQKHAAANFLHYFQAWKSIILISRAKAEADDAIRERDALKLRYQQEIQRMKETSASDLEFEREQFNLSIT